MALAGGLGAAGPARAALRCARGMSAGGDQTPTRLVVVVLVVVVGVRQGARVITYLPAPAADALVPRQRHSRLRDYAVVADKDG